MNLYTHLGMGMPRIDKAGERTGECQEVHGEAKSERDSFTKNALAT